MKVIVCELYSQCNRDACKGVWLILRYKEYQHDASLLELLFKVVFELDMMWKVLNYYDRG